MINGNSDKFVSRKNKILITGADGFIGSYLTEYLVRLGYNVKAFVLYNSFGSWGWLESCPKKIKDKLEIFSEDIRDPCGVKKAIKGFNTVLHLAFLIAIPFIYLSPETYVDTNVKGTLNVLQAARELELEKIVHTSTSEVNGTAQYVPIDETHPLQGQSSYSATKIATDQLAYSFYSSFGLPYITLRPFNTYRPRQSERAVIPTIITQIANGFNEINLGTVIPTRDFNYIDDTVTSFKAALEIKSCDGEVIHLGSNFEVPIRENVELIEKKMSRKVSIVSDKDLFRPKKSEVQRLCASNEKANRLLNWSPSYQGHESLSKGINKTIEWFTNPRNLKSYKPYIYNI